MIIYCSWEAKEQDCKDLFETEATDDGFCCSFNSIVIRRDAKTNSDKQLSLIKTQFKFMCNYYVSVDYVMREVVAFMLDFQLY